MDALAEVLNPDDGVILTQADYRKVLAGYFLPDSVVATKPASESSDWLVGGDRSVFHNCWLLCTDDRKKKKDDVTFALLFDTVIDIDGETLSSPTFLHDCLTKKIVAISGLTVGFRRRKLSAQSIYKLCQYLDWFVRWRNSLGITSNALLAERHFRDFSDALGGNDILDLLPMASRLDRVVAEIIAETYVLPLVDFGTGLRVEWTALAEKFGVGVRALSKSPSFRADLLIRLERLVPSNVDKVALAKHLSLEMKARGDVRSSRTIEGILEPWECLSRLSYSGQLSHDALAFDPFKDQPPHNLAGVIGRDRQRTATIPPADFLRILNAAATWVLDYSEHVIRVVKVLGDREAIPLERRQTGPLRRKEMAVFDAETPVGMPKIWLGWRFRKNEHEDQDLMGRITVFQAMQSLMTACAILIGGFGARRLGEITSLQAGCLVEDKPGLVELTIYIEKTLRDLDKIPVPNLVRNAVRCLETLSKDSRAATGEGWLFKIFRDLASNSPSVIDFRLDVLMNDFAKLNGLPLPEDWGSWMLKPHQLRRGFAVSYYHGFQAASLDALSRLLRHFDPEMTRLYVNEVVSGSIGRLREEIEARTVSAKAAITEADRHWLTDAKKLLEDLVDRSVVFNEVRCEALVHRMLSMWDGSDTVIGKGGARLYADLDGIVAEAQADVRLGSRSNDPDVVRDPLAKRLMDYAGSHYLEPVPGHAVHCICRPGHSDDLAQAECLKAKASGRAPWAPSGSDVDVRPDYSFSGAYVCLSCVHCAAFADNQTVIASAVAKIEVASTRGATAASRSTAAEMLAKFKARVAAAKAVSKDRA